MRILLKRKKKNNWQYLNRKPSSFYLFFSTNLSAVQMCWNLIWGKHVLTCLIRYTVSSLIDLYSLAWKGIAHWIFFPCAIPLVCTHHLCFRIGTKLSSVWCFWAGRTKTPPLFFFIAFSVIDPGILLDSLGEFGLGTTIFWSFQSWKLSWVWCWSRFPWNLGAVNSSLNGIPFANLTLKNNLCSWIIFVLHKVWVKGQNKKFKTKLLLI